MKKKGFTLIELLAVIVVLGILMLIAIPKISDVIDNAKKGAFRTSTYGIVKAANYYCATKKLSDLTYAGSSFTITDGKLVNGTEELPVSDITLEGNSFVNVDENCHVQMSVTNGIYYATKEYDEAGVAVTLSEDAALTRDQMTEEIEALQANVVTLNSKIDSLTDITNTSNVFLKTYPVGSIYMSKESANPSTLFGGTWIAWGSGRVPVGVDTSDTSFDTVEETGGEKTHTLTISEMPSHSHTATVYSIDTGTYNATVAHLIYEDGTKKTSWISEGLNGWISNSGSSQSHNNLQPYITVYMWKRTA